VRVVVVPMNHAGSVRSYACVDARVRDARGLLRTAGARGDDRLNNRIPMARPRHHARSRYSDDDCHQCSKRGGTGRLAQRDLRRVARSIRSDWRASSTPRSWADSPGMRRANQPISSSPAVRVLSGISGSRMSRVRSPMSLVRLLSSSTRNPPRTVCSADAVLECATPPPCPACSAVPVDRIPRPTQLRSVHFSFVKSNSLQLAKLARLARSAG
jgi:hypothetical protein